MEHDEHEMLIEYSEMTTFNFNSKEYEEVRKDYIECSNFVSSLLWSVGNFLEGFKVDKIIKE